jgi:hypothetical protein
MSKYKNLWLVSVVFIAVHLSGCGVLMDENRKSMALGYMNTAIIKPLLKGEVFHLTLGLMGAPVGVIGGFLADNIPYSAMPVVAAVATVGTAATVGYANSKSSQENQMPIQSRTFESSSGYRALENTYSPSSSSKNYYESNPFYGGYTTESTVNYCLIYNRNLREKKIRNICSFDISVKDGCVGKTTGNYREAKADYPYKGVYTLPSSGEYNINAMDGTYDVDSDLCEKDYGRVVRTACKNGQTPYFTSAFGNSSVCIVD